MSRAKRKRLQRARNERLVAYIHEKQFNLIDDPVHWARYGIETPEQLGDYLDAVSATDHAEYLRDPD